jgi:hypothetical protein
LAAAVTAGLFALAFISMRSVAPWSEAERETAPAPVIVPLVPSPPATTPRNQTPVAPAPRPTTVRRPVEQTPPIPAPSPSIVAPVVMPVAPPIAVPAGPPPIVADTTRPRDIAPQVPTVPILRHHSGLSDTAMAIRGGAAYAPAGVTIASRTRNSARLRDSIITEKLALVPLLANTTPMSGQAARALALSQSQTALLSQRSTSAGNWRDLHVPMGSGVGGVGAVNGGKTGVTMDSRGIGVSIPFPLFSSGPSAAERKRNEKLYAEYLATLRRLNDRILFQRDSLRADSLLLDALSKRRP